jgi:hypothetical protein
VVTATAASHSEIEVAWPVVEHALVYRVEHRKSPSSTWLLLVETCDPTARATGLDANATYNFRVRASNTSGTSGWSTIVSATTFEFQAPPEPPDAPSQVTAFAFFSTQATVGWQAVTGALSYVVARAVDGSDTWTQLGTPTSAGWVDSTVEAGVSYRFRVQSVNQHGSSAWTVSPPVTVPTEDQQPPVTLIPGNRLTLAQQDFEVSTFGWVARTTVDSFGQVTSDSFRGSACLGLRTMAAMGDFQTVTHPTCSPGDRMRVTGQVKALDAPATVYAIFQFINQAGDSVRDEIRTLQRALVGMWAPFDSEAFDEVVAPLSATHCRIVLGVGDANAGNRHRFDHIAVFGTAGTPPGPEAPVVSAGPNIHAQAGTTVRTQSPVTRPGPGDTSGTVTWEVIE